MMEKVVWEGWKKFMEVELLRGLLLFCLRVIV